MNPVPRFGMAVIAVITVVTALLPAGQGRAASQPDLQSLFPNRAEIFVDELGLSRLLLPSEVLAECRPDLSDLRVIDARGREVPYIVDGGPSPGSALEERVVFNPKILSAFRETVERESAPDLRRETYQLSLPEGDTPHWDLVIESRRPRFVRQFDLLAAKEGEEDAPVGQGSLFRLQEPLRERLRASLPSLDADSLRLTLEGEGDFFLEPSFRFESSRVLPEREQVQVPLTVRRLHSRAGRTVVELERPRGLVPDRLVVSTATGSFNRRFEIWDEGPGGADAPLGVETLYRLAGASDVERTEMDLEPARADRLRVVIDNGDSPPLEELSFQAALRRPSLVFSLDAKGPGGEAGSLLFGGARAFRPRYDVAALLATQGLSQAGEQARIAVELLDSGRLGAARLGPTTANLLWDPAPALAFAMRPGTDIATWQFGYRRAVAVPETSEGLLRLRLDAETVARCRQDLADLRLVDSQSRQWPYLLEEAGSMERVPLSVRGPRTDGATSRYFLDLPVSPLQLEELLLDGPALFFDRPFELLGTPAGRGEVARTLARGRLARRPEDPREIAVRVRGNRLAALELRIEDGDDPALVWTSIEARIQLRELLFVAPRGEYTLLFGNPDARRPRYELEQVRDLVLAVDSTSVLAGELIESPDRGAFSRFRGRGGWQQILLWSALVLAVLVLVWITLRLARQDPSDG